MKGNRQILRLEIRAKRQNLTKEEYIALSSKIKDSIINLEIFIKSENIACYLAFKGEVDVMPIIEHAWMENKTCYLPNLSKDKRNYLTFNKYSKNDSLHENKYGILEPITKSSEAIEPQNLDIVIVPLVGFDEEGNRLGQGGGYYDRTFEFKQDLPKNSKPYLIGIAYEFQKVDSLIKEPWDVPLDYVVTEEKIYYTNFHL